MPSKTVAPAFTKRHFEQVADALQGVREQYELGGSVAFGIEVAAESLAALFWEDNERFDRRRFLTACGIEGELVAGMPNTYRETPLFASGVR
jgi:hypothetical protein